MSLTLAQVLAHIEREKEKRDMEAAGYYRHGVTLAGDEKIEDVKVSQDGKSIWIKLA